MTYDMYRKHKSDKRSRFALDVAYHFCVVVGIAALVLAIGCAIYGY